MANTEVYALPMNWRREQREAMVAWLRANGIEYRDVPIQATITVADGVITVEVFKRNEEGRLFMDPKTMDPARETRQYPLLAAMDQPSRAMLLRSA